eukprot:359158-Rhodomonas_salina.2
MLATLAGAGHAGVTHTSSAHDRTSHAPSATTSSLAFPAPASPSKRSTYSRAAATSGWPKGISSTSVVPSSQPMPAMVMGCPPAAPPCSGAMA